MTTDLGLSKRIRETRLFKSGGVTKLFLREDSSGKTNEVVIPSGKPGIVTLGMAHTEDPIAALDVVLLGNNGTVTATISAGPFTKSNGDYVEPVFLTAGVYSDGELAAGIEFYTIMSTADGSQKIVATSSSPASIPSGGLYVPSQTDWLIQSQTGTHLSIVNDSFGRGRWTTTVGDEFFVTTSMSIPGPFPIG